MSCHPTDQLLLCVTVFIPKDTIGDVAAAVHKLFDTAMRPRLPPAATQDSNGFRKKVCVLSSHS